MTRVIVFACWLAALSSVANFFHSGMQRALKELAGSATVVVESRLAQPQNNGGPGAEAESSETDH